ncbi:MAG TPA: class I SAM-dependent methyltransferase [Chloroflexota bacterium]|nr:class I SAM-dependent methyltransferase [Chloroflexota bacterium]
MTGMAGTGAGYAGAAGDYEYRGLMAEAWDVLRADAPRWPDVAFYRDAVLASGQPVLDVACATGRLVLAYLEDGLDVDAVDVSPEMLAIVRRTAATRGLDLSGRLYQQAMEALALPRRYRTILVSSSSFQLLTAPEAAAEALRRFRLHLEPGGTLVMSLMLLWREAPPAPRFTTEWSGWREAVRPSDGATFRRRSRATFDMAQQLESTEDEYELLRDGQVVATEAHARAPATRWYTQAQAVALLREAGFTAVRLTSGFTPEPARPEDPVFCAFAQRP